MIGEFTGTPEEKLEQVASVFWTLAPQAMCRLSQDGPEIVCQAHRIDGEVHTENLQVEPLHAEIVRHAAMRLGKATHPPESIGEWERWASAWHLIQVYGAGAVDYAAEQVASLEADGSLSGAEVWRDVRGRVAVLQAEPKAWAGCS